MRVKLFAAFLISVGVIGCSPQGNAAPWQNGRPGSLEASAAPQGMPSLAPILAKALPAVVTISVKGTRKIDQNALSQDLLLRRFFNLPQGSLVERFSAVGSGVIVDAERGYIVTDYHVVRNAERIMITLADRRRLEAKLAGSDYLTDIAVLRIQPDHLTELPMGISKDLQVGDYVIAIGDPFGVGQAATFGIISALGKRGLGLEGYEDFIQTDASLNPGNSGGALIDAEGRLVGINTAILSESGGNIGVGFAIPVDMVRNVAQKLIKSGRVDRGELGVAIQDLTPPLAQALGLGTNTGALISDVFTDSPAATAGLKSEDVVTGLNGQAIGDSSQLRNRIGDMAPGTTIRLDILRDNQELTLTAVLESQKLPTSPEQAPVPKEQKPASLLAGLITGPIPKSDPNFGKVTGLYVEDVDPSSAAADAGIKPGDIILSADRVPVRQSSELERIARAHPRGVPLLMQIQRESVKQFVALEQQT